MELISRRMLLYSCPGSKVKGHFCRKTFVFALAITSLYFALLSFLSFVALSNHPQLQIPLTHYKNGSTVASVFAPSWNSIRLSPYVGSGNGSDLLDKTGGGSGWPRREGAFASDLNRSRNIFKCTPVHYRELPKPVVALASFPGSGNTWLRYLLQLSTGIFTGSVYKDFALLRNGFPGESVTNGRVLAVKTHESGAAARAQFHKAILLIRKPAEAILAEFNRRAAGHIGHAGRDKYTRNAGRYWSSFVAQKGKSWTATNLDWIERFRGPLLISMYHQLVQNTSQELLIILDFLGESVSDRVMTCVVNNMEGIYRRKKKTAQFNPFSVKMDRFLALQERTVETAIGRRLSLAPTTTLVVSHDLSFNLTNHESKR